MIEKYTIPRNIKVKETIAFGLSGKQVVYLSIGLVAAGGIIATGLPAFLKIGAIGNCIVASLALSLAKAHGQDLDKYIYESMKYPLRAKEFEGGLQYVSDEKPKKPLVVNVRFNLQ